MIFASRLRGALGLLVLCTAPAAAQMPQTVPPGLPSAGADVSLAFFNRRLSAFGHWLSHPVWGDVWQPNAARDFRPYFYGYWQYTSDYGWFWVSSEPYGDIVYHYGRWVHDPNFGWLWVPGYVWGPSWVTWRESDDYIGWLPMPPGYQDFAVGDLAPSYGPPDLYGYRTFYGSNFLPDDFAGLWIFVPTRDFARSDRRGYVFDKDRVRDLYRRSEDRTHYRHDRDSDRIVDSSIDKDALERTTHRHFDAPSAKQFLRTGTPVISVMEGQDIARRDRNRARSDARDANRPGQNPVGGIGGRADARIGVQEMPKTGTESRGFERRSGTPPVLGGNDAGAGSAMPILPRGAMPSKGNPAAVGAREGPRLPNPPSTEFSRGGRALPASPALPQVTAPQQALSGHAGRAFGGGAISSVPRPNAVPNAVPPSPPVAAFQSAPVRAAAAPQQTVPPAAVAPVRQAGPRGGTRSGNAPNVP
ncbi:MAG TPA: DUF6600 domain-containing protein [Micropepsaceae bacterium]|nr:DUF6600 domain-containing protein [Micropepsaceae bacterium]